MLSRCVSGAVAGFLGAVALYALFVGAFIVSTPGLLNRVSLAVRATIAFISCVAGIRLLLRRSRVRQLRGGTMVWLSCGLIFAVLVFMSYLYPIWRDEDSKIETRKLQEITRQLSVSTAATEIKLPRGYGYAVIRDRNRLTIHVSDRIVGRLFGIDMAKLDVVVVEMDRAGKIKRTWIDFF